MSGEDIQDPCGHLGGHPAEGIPGLVSFRCCNKYRKPSGCEHKLLSYISGGQTSDMGLTGVKLGCGQGSVLSGGSQGETLCLPFVVSTGRLPSCGPVHLQSQWWLSGLLHTA